MQYISIKDYFRNFALYYYPLYGNILSRHICAFQEV